MEGRKEKGREGWREGWMDGWMDGSKNSNQQTLLRVYYTESFPDIVHYELINHILMNKIAVL